MEQKTSSLARWSNIDSKGNKKDTDTAEES